MNRETHRLFSQKDIGGLDPGMFHNEMKYANLKMKFIIHIEEEIKFLEDCNSTTLAGGWSTHLQDVIKKRIIELKELHYSITTSK